MGKDEQTITVNSSTHTPDLTPLREFLDGLSALLDISISVYNSSGACIASSGAESVICAAVKTNETGFRLCEETYKKAVRQVIEKGKPHIFKCHTNQYVFAIPITPENGSSYVIAGGRVYLSGSEDKAFTEGLTPFCKDGQTLDALRREVKTIPPKSVFTIPNIVSNMVAPFFNYFSMAGAYGRDGGAGLYAEKERLKGFKALDQVYKSIAPVLDREELYEKILTKSSELVDAERGTLMILDNKNNVLSVKAAKGIDREIVENLSVKIGHGISGSIAARGEPMIVRDIENEVPSWKNRPKYKTKSFISIPLKLDNRVIGVLNVSDKLSGEVFSEEDLHLLQSFANYASIALERGAYYTMSEELKTLSMTDPLTGLFNRRYFRERLFEEVERVKRHGQSFTIFIADIDNFKTFNDRYGHLAGDEILKCVSRTLKDAVRSMDVVVRYGGEEFAVILPHTRKADSAVIAERMRRNVEAYGHGAASPREWPTISVGAAEYPFDARELDELINKADMAMYEAKKGGKNRVVMHAE